MGCCFPNRGPHDEDSSAHEIAILFSGSLSTMRALGRPLVILRTSSVSSDVGMRTTYLATVVLDDVLEKLVVDRYLLTNVEGFPSEKATSVLLPVLDRLA